MRTFISCLLLFVTSCCFAQSSVLSLDGTNECFYADSAAANGIRTIELWFKPHIDYEPSLQEYVGLVCRERGSGQNIHEFFIGFEPGHMTHPGHLRFSYFVSGTEYYDVFSDSNHFDAGIWYHAAGVFHPDSGMMFFIDGVRQDSSAPFYNATKSKSYKLAVGSWGYPPAGSNRFFEGSVEDVRVSSIPRYSKDFEPHCPNLFPDEYTIALWNLNEESGNIAHDCSGNAYDGTIIGGSWYLENPCITTGVEEQDVSGNHEIAVCPIPANDYLSVMLKTAGNYDLALINSLGIIVFDKNVNTSSNEGMSINTSMLPSGIYFLWIKSKSDQEIRKVLIAH